MADRSMDILARLAIARKLAAMTGADGAAAWAMVADVAERGADSPHAEAVAEAATEVCRPFAEACGLIIARLSDQLRTVAYSLGGVLTTAQESIDAGKPGRDG